jgi:hypothetical protein
MFGTPLTADEVCLAVAATVAFVDGDTATLANLAVLPLADAIELLATAPIDAVVESYDGSDDDAQNAATFQAIVDITRFAQERMRESILPESVEDVEVTTEDVNA